MWGFGCGKQGCEAFHGRSDFVDDARRLWRDGVRERACSWDGSGIPYSKSLAGVGGRFDGASECSEGWGDIVGGDGCSKGVLFSGVGGGGPGIAVRSFGDVGEALACEVST